MITKEDIKKFDELIQYLNNKAFNTSNPLSVDYEMLEYADLINKFVYNLKIAKESYKDASNED